jgi:hypothetical protein
VRRALAAAAFAALAIAPTAAATRGYVQVVSPSGRVLAAATHSAFDYPADGSLVHVGRVKVNASAVELADVSLLGGQVSAASVVLPKRTDSVAVRGVAVGGRAAAAKPNTIVSLGALGYAVISQQAKTLTGATGRVGMRLVLQSAVFGAPSGTQVLVGLPYRTGATRTSHHARTKASPLAVLGFSGRIAQATGFVAAPIEFGGGVGDRAAALVQRYLGIPYVWAGADPQTGFDCSGLVMYVYGQLGVDLYHYTGTQYHQGMRVPRSELRPGDIVFFYADAGVPGHEGMYIGGGRFVHAPSRGDVVKISSLDEPHYGLVYVGAVRPYASLG